MAHRRYDATRRGQFNEEDHDYQKPQENNPRSEHDGLPHKKNGVEGASGVDAEGREYGGDEKVAESGKPRGEATELPKKTARPYFSGRTHPFVAACTVVRDREPSTEGQVAESASETKLLLRY